jgi:very-short-patch-repair endonuclease
MYRQSKKSYSEVVVKAWFREVGLPEPVFEHKHIPGRLFRLDLAWPAEKVGIEVDGGTYGFYMTTKQGRRVWVSRGGHSSIKGQERDREKNNLGLVNGWRVIHVTPKELCTMEVADIVKQCIFRNKAVIYS